MAYFPGILLALVSAVPTPHDLREFDGDQRPGAGLAANDVPCRPGMPGFTAEVEVCLRGRVHRGRVIVEPSGRVHLEHLPPEAAAWAHEQLTQALALRCCGTDSAVGWDARVERRRRGERREQTTERLGGFKFPAKVVVTGTDRADGGGAAVTATLTLTRHRLRERAP